MKTYYDLAKEICEPRSKIVFSTQNFLLAQNQKLGCFSTSLMNALVYFKLITPEKALSNLNDYFAEEGTKGIDMSVFFYKIKELFGHIINPVFVNINGTDKFNNQFKESLESLCAGNGAVIYNTSKPKYEKAGHVALAYAINPKNSDEVLVMDPFFGKCNVSLNRFVEQISNPEYREYLLITKK